MRRWAKTVRDRLRSGAWICVCCTYFAVVSSPFAHAEDKPAENPAKAPVSEPSKEQPKAPNSETSKPQFQFEVLVVGPDGKPIPEARIEVRTNQLPKADQILIGKFAAKKRYAVDVTADAKGRMKLGLAKKPKSFVINITTPGYAPYWADWSSYEHSVEIPERFTAELDAGWSVGGVIVDVDAKPVPGVEVHPSIKFKKRPGDDQELYVGASMKTDAEGKWRFDSVPASMSEVHVRISHKIYRPEDRTLKRNEFGIDSGKAPTAKIEVRPGLTVTGKVTDEAGQPIAGAQVRTHFSNDTREAKTGEDGTYQLIGCEPEMARILVFAKGRATDMQQVHVAEGMGPVDFKMKPGGKVRIRVIDEKGNPVPKARIFFQSWRGSHSYSEFGHINQYADKNGVWEWNEAPLDAFVADICRTGGMQLSMQSIVARDEEYVFRPPPELQITGTVVDAETKEPIKKFRVIPGWRDSRPFWSRGEAFDANNGKFQRKESYPRTMHLIRVEADGYQAASSRDIKSDEGQVALSFELKKGKSIATTITDPDGAPATKATVAIGIEGSQIQIQNGDLNNSSTYCVKLATDEAGKVKIPPQDSSFHLVITHTKGYAHVEANADTVPETIQLQPWARLEGTLRIGKDASSQTRLCLYPQGLNVFGNNNGPNIHSSYDATTDKDGHFKFDRVVPGEARIGKEFYMMADQGAPKVTSAAQTPVTLVSGETTKIDLGGTGRAVIGKFVPPENFEGKIKWNFVSISVQPHYPVPQAPNPPKIPAEVQNDPAKMAAWMLEWQQTPAGKEWTAWRAIQESAQQLSARSPYFQATVAADGSFRIDDMPSGSFTMTAHSSDNRAFRMLVQNYHFNVPGFEGDRTDEEFDLGEITVK